MWRMALGEGVPKDDAEAVRWWEKAAEQGDVAAQINLGIAYNLVPEFLRTTPQPYAGDRKLPIRAMPGLSRALQ